MPAESVSSAALPAALFDLDGTLVRTFIDFPAMRRAMLALADRWGRTEAVAGEDDILEIVAKTAAGLPPLDGARARAEAYAILEAMEAEGCARPEPVAGATELLHTMRRERGVRVGVITRNARRIAENLLRRMDLPCDCLIAREDTLEFKPDPAPVLVACARLGVSPSEASMTGDLWADIAAGRAAGVALTVGIQWPHDPPGRFARCPPDFETPSLLAAVPLLLGAEPGRPGPGTVA